MAVQPPNTETHDIPTVAIVSSELAGFDDAYKLLENTQRLLVLGQLIAKLGVAELGMPPRLRLCPLHAAAVENLTRQMETVELVVQRVEEMKQRFEEMKQRFEELEREVGETALEGTLDHGVEVATVV